MIPTLIDRVNLAVAKARGGHTPSAFGGETSFRTKGVALWPWQPSKWQQQNSVHVTGDCRQSQMSETGITPASARNVAAQFLSPHRLVRRSLSQAVAG